MGNVTKMIFVIFVGLAFSPILMAQPSSTETSQAKLRIGYVKNSDIGCGCYFARSLSDLRKDRYIYSEIINEPAFINVNGKNLKLNPVASSEANGEEKVGQRSWETFTARDLKIRLEKVVTKVCDPNDESCEVTYYNATLTVS
ncbi:MAG TPA: hypothetical protein VEF04_21390 [Blastocatellia bacterium]|nr:hypothetical protein [Blastocatellia bacterium]